MKNRAIKYRILESGLFDIYSRYRYVDFLLKNRTNIYNDLPDTQKAFIGFDYQFNTLPFNEQNSLVQLFDAKVKKTQRLKNRIRQMLMFNCVFLTLTFTDDVLNSTTDKTRRIYVARFLKAQNSRGYVANIDFGQRDNFTKREHYHCLIVCDKVDLSLWTYGIINAEKVRKSNASALSKYINKFTSHAYKKGASSTRLIFSRGFSTSFCLDRVQQGIYQYTF